jgi:hypothetical protein
MEDVNKSSVWTNGSRSKKKDVKEGSATATSGMMHKTSVYIPSGANGIPLVKTVF